MIFLAFLLAIASTVWLVPIAHFARTSTLVMAILLVGTVLGPPFWSFDGPIQISLDRILWGIVGGLVGVRLLTRRHELPVLHRVDVMWFLLIAWALLSCVLFGLFKVDYHVPLQPPVARWLFYLAIPFSVYMMARIARPDASEIERIVSTFIVLGTYLGVTAVFEMIGLRSLVFPRFINNPDLWEFYGRGRGPVLNPAGNGILMTVGLSAATIRFFQAGRIGRIAYPLLAAVMLAGCYATLTRSVWMGAAGAVAIIVYVNVPRSIRLMGLVGVLLLGVAMTMGLKEQLMSFKRDEALSAAESAKSVELRPLLAIVAFEMFADRPMMGHGYGHYLAKAKPYHTIRTYEMPLETVRPYVQHNVFFSHLVDLGLPGLLAMLLALGSVTWTSWRMIDNPVGDVRRNMGLLTLGTLSGYVCNGMFHDVSVIQMVHVTLFFITGCAVSASQSSPQPAASGAGIAAVPAVDRRRPAIPSLNVDRQSTAATMGGQ